MTEEDRKERRRESARKYREKNRDKVRASSRDSIRRKRAADPIKAREGYRKSELKRRYGMNPEDYDVMLIAQNFRCAICRTDTPGGAGRFHVDHCHTTGAVRALLCHECNTGLGKFKDNPELLAQAITYLETHRACTQH